MSKLDNDLLTSRHVPFAPESFRLLARGEEVCRITFDDGEITINPKYSASEAAKAFWKAVIALKPLCPITIYPSEDRFESSSDSLRLINGNEEICRITVDDGEITINPKYSASEAAKAFCHAAEFAHRSGKRLGFD